MTWGPARLGGAPAAQPPAPEGGERAEQIGAAEQLGAVLLDHLLTRAVSAGRNALAGGPQCDMLTTWPRVVNPRNTGAPKATVTDFDQNTYVPGGFDRALSVDTIGQHFVPPARGQGAERKLVVALHGRQSGTPRPARAPRTFRLKSAPDRGRRRNGPSNEPDASCFPGRR